MGSEGLVDFAGYGGFFGADCQSTADAGILPVEDFDFESSLGVRIEELLDDGFVLHDFQFHDVDRKSWLKELVDHRLKFSSDGGDVARHPGYLAVSQRPILQGLWRTIHAGIVDAEF